MRVAPQVMPRLGVVPTEAGVVVAEPVAPVVTAAPILGLTGLRLERKRVGAEPKIASANVDAPPAAGGGDHAAAVAVCAVHPVVEPVLEAVHPVLMVALAKAGEQHPRLVSPAVAVRVLRKQDVRRGADEHPVAPRHHAGGESESIQKHRRVVVAAVTVAILQPADAPSGLAFPVEAKRIVGHLGNPQPPGLVPLECDRIRHQRLGGHQLDPVAGQQFH